MTGIYQIGGKRIAVSSLFDTVHAMCADYHSDGEADFSVVISPEDICFEREKSRREAKAEGRGYTEYSDAYLETLAVYRKIVEQMPAFDTVLLHGSCVAVDGRGYLFTAPSGTGKSTHTRYWRQLLGDRAVMVNDDKPLLHVGDGAVTVFGTPWNGKHRLGCRMEAPLQGICILERAPVNHIERIQTGEARVPLLQQIYRPADPGAMARTLVLFEKLLQSVPLYRLGCRPDLEAAELAYHMMEGKTDEA